jgi:hypothetical protein
MGLNQPLHEGGSVCQTVCVTHHLQRALQRQKTKGLRYNRSLHARVTSSDDVTKALCTNQCRMFLTCTNQCRVLTFMYQSSTE